MTYITEPERKTEVRGEYDVVVAGGGVAGIASALAARRNGAETLLVERGFALGGLATLGLVTVYLPLCDGLGNQVSFGIAEELLRLSVKHGAEGRMPEKWLGGSSREERAAGGRFEVQFSANVFAILCEQLLLSEGVDILYGTTVCSIAVENGRITHLVVENKSGRSAIGLKSAVDATGDADVCALAGEETALYPQKNILAAWYYSVEGGRNNLHPLGYCETPDADRNGSGKSDPAVHRFTGIDARENSEFMFRSHVSQLTDFLSAGDLSREHSLSAIPAVPQLRMTRRIVGVSEVTQKLDHCKAADSAGLFSNWKKSGPVYALPLSSLYGRRVKNLICAGRCISADNSMWDVMRVIPVCAVSGEAAGTAASMSDDFANADLAQIQSALRKGGVKLHFDEL